MRQTGGGGGGGSQIVCERNGGIAQQQPRSSHPAAGAHLFPSELFVFFPGPERYGGGEGKVQREALHAKISLRKSGPRRG